MGNLVHHQAVNHNLMSKLALYHHCDPLVDKSRRRLKDYLSGAGVAAAGHTCCFLSVRLLSGAGVAEVVFLNWPPAGWACEDGACKPRGWRAFKDLQLRVWQSI